MGLVLQQRDLEIMRYVFLFRVVTYDQIRRKFFPKNAGSAARKRIRDLCDAHFLKSFYVQKNKRSLKCVSLCEGAWPSIESYWPFEVDKPYFKSESVEHDIRLAEVVMRLEGLTVFVDFKTENLLQSSSSIADDPAYRDLVNIQADGALTLKDPHGHSYLYAIEFEISKKANERYRQKLSGYYQAGSLDGVIYICGNQEIADVIAKTDREIRTGKDSIVYMGTELSVLGRQGKMFFKNVERDGLGLY